MPNKLSRFWHELNRRRVIHVIVVYASAAFVIIELVNNIYETLNLPEWTPAFALIVLSIGFPLAIIFSWIYDISSKGITKTAKEVPSDSSLRYENSIAVLPFQDMSQEKDQEYFCDGIAEEIINALAHVSNLKVIARTSAFAFKNQNLDMRELGKKLNVETILEGSIRKDNNKVRITAQLIKTDDGSHLWSERFDRNLEDIFAIQDEIALSIVDNLKIELLGEEKNALVRHHTYNLKAHNLYLRGIHFWQMMTANSFEKATGYFEQALQDDPEYALAYVGLASVQISSSYWGTTAPNEAFPTANEYLNKALELDNSLAEAYCYLGVCELDYYWNYKKAEENFIHALKLNSNKALLHINYSLLLSSTNRHKEAIAEAKRAQELDPLSCYINTYTGQVYYFGGHFDKAIEEYQSVISLNPNYYLAHFFIALPYIQKGKYVKAYSNIKKAYELSNGVPVMVAWLACVYLYLNKKKKADKLINKLKNTSSTEYVPASCFFLIHKIKGEEELAFKWLEKACKEREGFVYWSRITPKSNAIPSLNDEPGYKELFKKYGLN